MASVETKKTYVLEMTEDELDTVRMALDNVACDEDLYGDVLSTECSKIWRVLNV